MQIRSLRESVTKARGPPAPKSLSKIAGCTAGKIVGAPRLAGPQSPADQRINLAREIHIGDFVACTAPAGAVHATKSPM